MRHHQDPDERFTPCDALRFVTIGGLLVLLAVLERFDFWPPRRPPWARK